MIPQWRTSTVLALCRRMLDSREFDVLPILSDALQDAGCTDEDLLKSLRKPIVEPVDAERLVNLVYSEETAAAVRWLENFALHIGYEGDDPPTYNYRVIIEIGKESATSGFMTLWNEEGADFFRQSDANLREFFRNWSLVTGVPVSTEMQQKIVVSCAC